MTTSDKPRLLLISRAYSKNGGGMERLSYELIQELKKRCQVDTLVHEISTDRPLQHVRVEAVLFALRSIPLALAKAQQAEVIHLGDPVLSFIGWLIKMIFRKPVAVTVHGLDIEYPHPLYQWYLRLFFRHFDAYIPISSHAKQSLHKHNVTGHVTIIPPGIKDRFHTESTARDALSQLLGIDVSNKVVLLTVGRLVKRKGHAWFIRHVLPQLPSQVVYVIAGQGSEKSNIEAAADEAGVEDRVILLGRVAEADLEVLYNTVDAFIQPNIHVPGDAEGFGIVLLEAALCSRPVFAAHLEGIADAIHNGKNGTLLPAKDSNAWLAALQAFLREPKLSPLSRAYTLENFSWGHISQQYISLFTRVAKTKK